MKEHTCFNFFLVLCISMNERIIARANVDNANQWIVHWNPVESKLNEMRPDPPACIAHTSMFADYCLKLHVLEVAHVYYRTQCGNLPQSRNNERYRYVAYRQFVMWIMDILPTWKKYPCTAVIFRETFPSQNIVVINAQH
ncbi:hypothetical protein CAPTEDRAFT_197419 [Capitella teleta]|uniref:P2X purinoreceptor 7 intracellular domain-containing protein n=1 Tax=Capitella teleta TaxID=283909 RepID=R7VJC9_CAPTE|nr:hypothetical protein CAPTEDRAFT_197419 [Capitella teleta]|eukprot:ELU15870.1 hypothetical protein CAPTEDRAFT_197419 [Capitella teleta]